MVQGAIYLLGNDYLCFEEQLSALLNTHTPIYLTVIHEWSVLIVHKGVARVGLSKLTTNVNQVDRPQAERQSITYLYYVQCVNDCVTPGSIRGDDDGSC